MYYVYVLKSLKDGNLYIGYSSDLKERLRDHNSNPKTDSYTFRHRPWSLVYYEAFSSKRDAVNREKKLKEHGSSKHLLLQRIHSSITGLE